MKDRAGYFRDKKSNISTSTKNAFDICYYCNYAYRFIFGEINTKKIFFTK